MKRINGRCKLIVNNTTTYDNHCVFKHKQRGGVDVFAINLDNGQEFKFRGENLDALQIEDYSGIHNVKFQEKDGGDKDVFRWQSQGSENKLVIKLDNETPVNGDTSISSQDAVGALVTVGVAALIGSLISDNQSSNNSNNSNNSSQPTAQLPKMPYKTGDYYNATAYFKCSVGNSNHDKQCPAGIVRRGNGNASVVVLYPNGYEVQYDFKNGNVTSTYNGDLNWGKSGDEWYIGIDNKLFIIIPDAAIYGG